MVPGIESGWFQQHIAASARRQQREVESGQRVIVGVYEFREGSEDGEIDVLRIDPAVEPRQRERMARLRRERDAVRVQAALQKLEAAARGQENLFPHLLACAHAYCTLYEIRYAMEKVFGSYKEPDFF